MDTRSANNKSAKIKIEQGNRKKKFEHEKSLKKIRAETFQ
jgi:hypothetical protein